MENGLFVPSKALKAQLSPGTAHHIRPGVRHQVIATKRTFLMEVSTEHFDEDSIRLEKGD